MGHLKKICVLVSLIALTLAALSCKKEERGVIGESGKAPDKKEEQRVIVESGKAPDFTLNDLQGSSIKLSELRGKVVIVDFWATWCPPCREAIPDLNTVSEKFRDKNFRLLGISVDKGGNVLSSLRAFVKEFGIVYPVMVDNGSVHVAYGVSSIPVMFVIDKEGKVVKRHMGYFPGLAEILSKDVEGLL